MPPLPIVYNDHAEFVNLKSSIVNPKSSIVNPAPLYHLNLSLTIHRLRHDNYSQAFS